MHYYLDPAKKKPQSNRVLFYSLIFGFLAGIIFSLQPACAKTKVYKQVQPDGHVEYSDQPTQESTQVILPNIPVRGASALPMAEPSSGVMAAPLSSDQKTVKQQVEISISSPIDKQLFVSTVTEVPVALVVRPTLEATQKIKLLLDNQPYGEPQNTTNIVLKNVERGTHELKAMVIDNDNQVLATSAPILFHQQRQIIQKK